MYTPFSSPGLEPRFPLRTKSGNNRANLTARLLMDSTTKVVKSTLIMEGDNRGARSGNTFRKIGSKFQKSKQPRAVIIRHSSNLSRRQSSNEADDGYISADAVQYSLNKKGRWNLPEVIQENIFDHDFDDDFSEVRVSMLHRHLVNRQSDCLRVITNTLRDDQGGTDFSPRRKKARRRTYCNGMNILHNGRGKQTKNPRKKQVISTKLDIAARKAELQEAKAERDCRSASDIEDSKGSNSTPEVRYDVFYPLPAMSSLRSHPKFAPCLVRPDDIEQPLRVTAGLKAGKRSKKRNKYVQMDDTFFDDDCFFEDDFDENYSEEDMLSAKSFPENCSSPFATSLSEVLEEALYVASRQPSDPEDFGLADFDALAQASGKPRRKRSSKKKDRKYVYQTEQTFQTGIYAFMYLCYPKPPHCTVMINLNFNL
ncbi:hypothetical protein BaRGS_00023789 [Batillaria attramentaria]|uniref:Uncharacterized protein n=1 Tax=Batillaria attramentaria TaxID=370345 RepID=A0ABD0KD54_9CAEN